MAHLDRQRSYAMAWHGMAWPGRWSLMDRAGDRKTIFSRYRRATTATSDGARIIILLYIIYVMKESSSDVHDHVPASVG